MNSCYTVLRFIRRNNETLCVTKLCLCGDIVNLFVASCVKVFLHVCVSGCRCVCVRERERVRDKDGRSLGDSLNPFVETGTVTSEHVRDESEC